MSKTNQKIESRLAGGMQEMAPDDAGRILSLPAEEATGKEEYLSGLVAQRKRGRAVYRVIAAAACLVMLLTVGYRFQFSACYAVGLDANPSLTLTLNRMERVLSVTANNEDGIAVLEDLSLERETCDSAVERILDRMLELGYLREGQGQVLLSVQEMDGRNGEAIRSRLSREADRVLGGALEEHGVFSRVAGPEEGDIRAAREYGITQGKAELAGRLCVDYPDLEEGQLARMSIGEMMDLLVEKEVDLSRYGSYTGTSGRSGEPAPAEDTAVGSQDTGAELFDPAPVKEDGTENRKEEKTEKKTENRKEEVTETETVPRNGGEMPLQPLPGAPDEPGKETEPDRQPAGPDTDVYRQEMDMAGRSPAIPEGNEGGPIQGPAQNQDRNRP